MGGGELLVYCDDGVFDEKVEEVEIVDTKDDVTEKEAGKGEVAAMSVPPTAITLVRPAPEMAVPSARLGP